MAWRYEKDGGGSRNFDASRCRCVHHSARLANQSRIAKCMAETRKNRRCTEPRLKFIT